MKKVLNYIMLISLLLVPIPVFASESSGLDIEITEAILMEIFISIHATIFVLVPLAKILTTDPKKVKEYTIILFIFRVIILIIGDLLTPKMGIVDFLSIAILSFLVFPISLIVKTVRRKKITKKNVVSNEKVICKSCGKEVEKANYCSECGKNILDTAGVLSAKDGKPFNLKEYSNYLLYDNDMYLENLITEELSKNDGNNIILPSIEKRKLLFTIIYAVIFILLMVIHIAYHKLSLLIIGSLVITFIYYIISKKYNAKNYIKKQIKSRPDEKMTYIIASVISSRITNNRPYTGLKVLIFLIAIMLPIAVFYKPYIIYEKSNEGYSIRYYTLGILKQDDVIEIPSTYKGKTVIGIRGDVFSNVKSIKEVKLPNTIKEIRGGAFNGTSKLEKINIEDTKITEIKGDTFQFCKSLKSIKIPDSVTRIGGHAFYGDRSLSNVYISKNSKLNEIGSSAFRECYNLDEIIIPSSTYVNERAFKDSPTNIKRYGEFLFEENYKYIKKGIYAYKDRESLINHYNSDSNLYLNSYIKLEQINKVNNLNEFIIKYRDNNGEKIVILTKDKPYEFVSNDLVLEVSNDYYFSGNYNAVSLNAYYN